MTNIGVEIWGLKFSWLLTALLAAGSTLFVWLTANNAGSIRRVDKTAGDEGEEW